MTRDALTEKRTQLVAACEEYATVATTDAVAKFDAAEQEIRAIDEQLESMAVRSRLDAMKAKGNQIVTRPENRFGGRDAELARFFATRGREGSGEMELRTTLTVSTAATAGNTVPQSIMTGEFIKFLDFGNPVRTLATRQTVPSALRLPVINARTTVTATAENAAYTESNFTTTLKTFGAFKATATTPVTEELLFDSAIDVAAEIVADHGRAHGKYREQKYSIGQGTTEETGIFNSDTNWDFLVKTGALNVAPDFDDCIQLFTIMPAAYTQNAVWLMAPTVWALLLQTKSAASGNYLYDGMNGMLVQNGSVGLLMGRPVYLTEFSPEYQSGTGRNLIWFGDLARGYRIVDRKDITYIVDPYTNSSSGITNFRSSMRSDAQIVDKKAGGLIANKV
jgi:HK97 family phage major capsid protein